jgi:class 3 adenylate cyclase/tetratricopeptide (TPR) repeat protein
MGRDILAGILKEIGSPSSDVLALLEAYQDPANDPFWRGDSDARLYRTFARRLIAAGHLYRAYDLVQNGLNFHKGHPELCYLAGLALARAGNMRRATEYADGVLKQRGISQSLKMEAISLKGRLKKDEYERTTDATIRLNLAAESASFYQRAYAVTGDSFPGINLATMTLLAGRPEEARALAAELHKKVSNALMVSTTSNSYWELATLGEASIILGRIDEAERWYRDAAELAKGQIGDRASMRRQVLLLAQVIDGLDRAVGIFNVGAVVVFAGHMMDHPHRSRMGLAPRFPHDPPLERAVAHAIGVELDTLEASVAYASVACGSDILFGEDVTARGSEYHVVLPFALEDFYHTSVHFGAATLDPWRERCDKLLAAATEVHYSTTEHYWADQTLFEWVNTVTQGLAITHAMRLGVEPIALVVLDGEVEARRTRRGKPVGGTSYFLDRWRASGYRAKVIDLAKIRASISATDSQLQVDSLFVPATVNPATIARKVKFMLFADVKNYSKLHDEKASAFFSVFLDEIAAIIDTAERPPEFQNTWGDGLYFVFGNVLECAEFAMRLLDRVRAIDWSALGLPGDTAVRMGIHAGPVYRHLDKIIGRQNYFGSHVNRAARIEPVTPPGSAFTSEQFAAALAVEASREFVCEFVGIESLAKDYDRCALYRLARLTP